MQRETILAKLSELIKPYVPDEAVLAQISEETDLLKDLKINSAHLVDIILDTEDAFDIEIDDELAEKMLTVKDAVAVIEGKLNHRP